MKVKYLGEDNAIIEGLKNGDIVDNPQDKVEYYATRKDFEVIEGEKKPAISKKEKVEKPIKKIVKKVSKKKVKK